MWIIDCDSPTSTQYEIGVTTYLSGTDPTPPPTHTNFKGTSRQPRKLNSGMHLILTQLYEIWKNTSIFLKMEDDLNFLKMEDDLVVALGNLGS